MNLRISRRGLSAYSPTGSSLILFTLNLHTSRFQQSYIYIRHKRNFLLISFLYEFDKKKWSNSSPDECKLPRLNNFSRLIIDMPNPQQPPICAFPIPGSHPFLHAQPPAVTHLCMHNPRQSPICAFLSPGTYTHPRVLTNITNLIRTLYGWVFLFFLCHHHSWLQEFMFIWIFSSLFLC